MTYGVKSYEFTAFAEADLLQGVNGGSIGCGDTFTMPSNPTACFEVKDDDSTLSGDRYRNEAGDDSSYQTANIEVDGVQVSSNAKIYAESYHVLRGSDGKTYYMIEIELKHGDAVGEGDDYFTFYGNVPPDGVSLTVVNTCNVSCDWVDYKCLSAGEKDWVIDEETCTYTLEAEDMELWGYKGEHNDAASGDELIKLKQDVGYAKADFGGESGDYNIKIAYVDENDGEGFIDVFVNGQFVGCIDLSANNNGNGVNNTTFSTFVIEGVEINQGDEIKLKGRKDGGEYARIDKIEFEQVKEPEFRECDDPNAVKIDFNDLSAGDVVAAQFEDIGVTITAQRKNDDPNSENDAMVFDSANPTGGDTDLATANQGNVLIVSEDNDSSDPDDNIGGTVVFDFANPSFVFDIKVIDTEEGGLITLFDADGAVIDTVAIPQIGDGEIAQVLIDADDVSSMQVTLNGSGAVDDLCFVPGEEQLGSLAGRYFCDTDGDNLDNGNGGEPGLNGLTVTLQDGDGNFVATTTTQTIDGVDGSYLFENLAAGDYQVVFQADPDGKVFVAQTAGDNDAIGGSDVDPNNGETGVISLGAGENKVDVDAGVIELGSISGRYFCDTDGDDLDNNNGDEPGENGIEVRLLDANGVVIATAVTSTIDGVDGAYFFGDLAAGAYSVEFAADPDGKVFVAQTLGDNDSVGGSDADPTNGRTGTINLGVGEDVTDVDVGVVELGSISGRYFCDTDGDDLDNNNGDEPGVNGVRVSLFDVDAGLVATAFTSTIDGVDGAYFFGDLPAGDYRVEFAADPTGKVFVSKNNESDNDAIGGSDADPTNGQTDVINLSVGEDVTDVDVGVVEVNVDPEAENAAGALCAVTDGVDAITFDLSALVSDADGDVLSFIGFTDAGEDNTLGTADDQAFTLGDGDSFTLSSGAQVSLAGDILTYNLEGTGAYDDLLINDTALDVIGFEVSDGNGGTANGQIDATVKGSLNTLETIEASLPTGEITFTITDELASNGTSDAFTLTISASDDDRLNGKVFEEAYCVARPDQLIDGASLQGNIFLADADSVPAGFIDQVGGFGNTARENLDLVNWILNQDFGSQDNGDGTGETYTDSEVQAAIWGLTDNIISLPNPSVGTPENAIEIALAAQAQGEGFEAGAGDIVGLFIEPTLATQNDPGHVQPFIIGVKFDDLAEECIC